VPAEEFRKKFLVDGNLTAIQSRKFLLIIVYQDHFVPKVGEAGTRDQSNISGTYNCDTHEFRPQET
jgi:hypothetical protein